MVKKEEIERFAELSRIDVSKEEIEALVGEIESILDYVSEIQSVSSGEPEKKAGQLRNVFREDGAPHESGIYTKEILEEAPRQKNGYIQVKIILSQELKHG